MALVTDIQDKILKAREARMVKEKDLLATYHSTLIVFSLNLPGGIAISQRVLDLHRYGVKQLVRSLLPYESRLERMEVSEDPLGPIGYICLDIPWEKAKSLAIDIESQDMYGRLFDIDVIASTGQHIGRADLNHLPRQCFICNEQATVCRRKSSHTREEIESYIGQLLNHFQVTMEFRNQRVN